MNIESMGVEIVGEESPVRVIKSTNYSALILSRPIYTTDSVSYDVEIIPFLQDGELNHDCVKKFDLDAIYEPVRDIQVTTLLEYLESQVKDNGKTPEQALTDYAEPTPEEVEKMNELFGKLFDESFNE